MSGRGNRPPLLSCSSQSSPPACLSCSPLGLLPMPRKDPRDLEGALEGRGSAWELSRLPWPQWAGQLPSAALPLLLDGPSHLPLLISPASGALILSGLHFSSTLSPLHPTGSFWGSSHLFGCQSPPPVAGRCPSCGETLTLHLPTPPS